MVVHVVTAFDDRYEPIAAATLPRMAGWAERFGYRFTPVKLFTTGGSQWAKINAILNHCQEDDTVIWIDADIFVIDQSFSMERFFPRNGIAFSSDSNGICSGFFIATGYWAFKFLDTAQWLGPTERQPQKHEQDAFKAMIDGFPGVRKRTSQIPQEVISNPEQPWREGVFAYHAWAGDWKESHIKAKAEQLARLAEWTPEHLEEIKR